MTPDELRADHAKALVHAAKHVDFKGNKNAPEEVAKIAFNGVRSKLFGLLQAENPPPSVAEKDEDAEDFHQRQKSHNKKLWKQVEKAVAAAGLSESGAV